MRRATLRYSGGQLLIEVLVALAIFLAIATILAQAITAAFIGEKTSRGRAAAAAAIDEMFAEVRAISEASWGSVSGLSRGVVYSTVSSGTSAAIVVGTATDTVDGVAYTRSFTLSNVARQLDAATGTPPEIIATGTARVDSATLRIDGTVSWGLGESLTAATLLTRWRNVVCGQNSWSASTTGSSTPCETLIVGKGAETNIDTSQGLKLCNGC